MMSVDSYDFWGMHSLWWIIWVVFLVWIFLTPYRIPGQRNKTVTPVDILKKRFALGEISKEEYIEKRKLIDI